MRRSCRIAWLAGLLCLTAAARCAAGDDPPELDLKPCTIELVEGTTIKGNLAAQFKMKKRLIVYSPRLASVRSFLKDHVHALTVEGKREQLNPKRQLTDADRELLGKIEWPDEQPAEGHRPAYTTETWVAPERLVVWSRPGDSGRGEEAGNWWVNGMPVKRLPHDRVGKFQPAHGEVDWQNRGSAQGRSVLFGRGTDVLVPCAEKRYQVRVEPIFSARHITVENNAIFHGRNTPGVFGNVWIAERGDHRVSHGYFPVGDKHTFFLNEKPALELGQHDRDGVARRVARYIQVLKGPGASVEFLGVSLTTDEFHIRRGTMVLAEDAQMLVGNRCTQSISPEAALQMHSGSFFGKHANEGGNDMVVMGALSAGTPERPLTRDCILGLGYHDWWGDIRSMKAEESVRMGPPGEEGQIAFYRVPWLSWREGRHDWPAYFSLTVTESGRVRVHSANPSGARLVLRWHERDGFPTAGAGAGDLPVTDRQKELFDQRFRGRINAVFAGDVRFDGVVFDDFHKGGILLANPALRNKWTHVFFGPDNHAEPDDLFASIPKNLEIKGSAGGRWQYGEDEVIPLIGVPPGVYAQGSRLEIKVRLPDGQRGQIRFTLDGTIVRADSPLYSGPVTITSTSSLKARAFGADGARLGREARARYRFEKLKPRVSDAPSGARAGLAYEYHHTDRGELSEREPEARGVAPTPNLSMRTDAGHSVVFTGYVSVDRPGIWTFCLTSDGNSELHVGERLVVDNTERGPRQRTVKTHAGQISLDAGLHAIRIVARDCHKPFDVAWRGPGRGKEPLPASALRHVPRAQAPEQQ
jgi:hypothetical protein